MARRGDRDRGAVAVGRDERAHGGHQRQSRLLAQHLVDERQHARGPRVEAGGHAGRVAHQRGQGGRLDALAGHVAEHDQVAALDRQDVVEVAAHVGVALAGLVSRARLPARQLGQALRQQARLQRVRHALLRRVQARVLHRGGGAQREVLDEAEVVLVEAAAALGRDQRDHAERLVAEPHRHGHGRAHAQLADQPQVLLVPRGALDQLLRDLRVELGRPAAQDRRHAGRSVRVGRVAAPQVVRHLDLARVDVGDRDLVRLAVLVDHLDAAPVGEPGDDHARHALERLLVVERGGEELARLGQEPLAQLGVLGLGDVLDDVDGQPLAPGIDVERGLGQQPQRLARVAPHAAGQQRGLVLAGHEAAARQVLEPHRRAVLARDVEALRQLAGLRGQHVVDVLGAQQADRRVVDVDRLTALVVHGHGLAERSENAVEPRLRAAQLDRQALVGAASAVARSRARAATTASAAKAV